MINAHRRHVEEFGLHLGSAEDFVAEIFDAVTKLIRDESSSTGKCCVHGFQNPKPEFAVHRGKQNARENDSGIGESRENFRGTPFVYDQARVVDRLLKKLYEVGVDFDREELGVGGHLFEEGLGGAAGAGAVLTMRFSMKRELGMNDPTSLGRLKKPRKNARWRSLRGVVLLALLVAGMRVDSSWRLWSWGGICVFSRGRLEAAAISGFGVSVGIDQS